ncbi:uncharacterized protein F4822DRAFT_39354 [Hypoxylon trugodes]|uniref:uncharacterized protein n=1 Tax=Hypoxylon trugodes TaxID=326681 RepID=UPI00218F9430|nr:uncharacterized protein F4822DRAFT_39354 [Hypoxylon trugodes]KAI1394164.1 hypothetical protein F4822DRAFT_39354 [Hypoxylon trugodes]
MSLSLRIRETLQQDIRTLSENERRPIPWEMLWEDFYTKFESGDVPTIHYYSREVRYSVMRDALSKFYDAATDLVDHVRRLDELLSELLKCQWWPSRIGADAIVERAELLLRRIPKDTLHFPGRIDELPSEYFSGSQRTWGELKVASHLHQNVLRFAIFHVLNESHCRNSADKIFSTILNCVGEMIEASVKSHRAVKSRKSPVFWYIVKAFL